jgi:O-antigen/teichoic acid export membrane protein
MEKTATPVEKLIEKAEIYSKTSLELLKYNSVYKSADIFSTLATKLAIAIAFAVFCMLINVGLSLWIGNILGKSYYGFFIIAIVYLLIAILIYYFRYKWIKKPVSNFIIKKLLNPHQDENQR